MAFKSVTYFQPLVRKDKPIASTMATEVLSCPFCNFRDTDGYILTLHVEELHTEESPFVVKDSPYLTSLSSAQNHSKALAPSSECGTSEEYCLCPEDECGEEVLLTELNEHLDLHMAEKITEDAHATQSNSRRDSSSSSNHMKQNFSTDPPDALRRGQGTHKNGNEKSSLRRSILSLGLDAILGSPQRSGPSTHLKVDGRLGRDELGPYAWEEQMPTWLYRQLEKGPRITPVNRLGRDGRVYKHEVVENETPGIVPVLAQLCAADRSVEEAYLCHPSVRHVGKTVREGSFCGYRNIQMLISYIQGVKALGHDRFPGRIPGILALQDAIERAWDKGIDDIGRRQTGGIRGTRKYIGTSEARALFLGLDIVCDVNAFSDRPDGPQAYEQLLSAVEQYFKRAKVDPGSKIHKTPLPPIYLQQPGHSLTIVGLEKRRDGTSNLLTFDSSFKTSPKMNALVGRRDIGNARPDVLRAYRRGQMQLGRHRDFEVLMLTAPQRPCPPEAEEQRQTMSPN